jgi:hypothetical protein
MTFYHAVKHIPHSNHESDLYLLACHEAHKLMQQYEKKGEVFRSNVDSQYYYDIPFAYEPWWEARQPKQVPA